LKVGHDIVAIILGGLMATDTVCLKNRANVLIKADGLWRFLSGIARKGNKGE
jgi:hypothetical protein